jgi:hypothetical protein
MNFLENILSTCIRGVRLLDGVWIGCLDLLQLYIQLVTTNTTALSLICTLYKSLGHAKFSIIVTWHRILTD